VRANSQALERHLEGRMAQLRSQFNTADMERFDECLDILLGEKKAFTSRPTFLHFPRLPAVPFYDRHDFPSLDVVEAEVDVIREELMDLLEADFAQFRPYVSQPAGTPVAQWSGLNNSMRWSSYFLWQDGRKIEDHCARCPRTAEILGRAGMADLPGYAPTAFFSVLEPHTVIPAHVGATNVRVICHVPLIVPENCRFRVGNVTREWEPGRGLVFDDTIEHEATNDSDEVRVVLIFDLWNPQLTAPERELVCALLGGLDVFNRAG
jgi:aspartyl/asparaginyl beta-hydroxylase (cupin superfamily)